MKQLNGKMNILQMESVKVKDFEIYLNDECKLVGSSRKDFVEKLTKLFKEEYDDTDYYLYDKENNQYVRFYWDGEIGVHIFDDNEENDKIRSILVCTHYDLMCTDVLK